MKLKKSFTLILWIANSVLTVGDCPLQKLDQENVSAKQGGICYSRFWQTSETYFNEGTDYAPPHRFSDLPPAVQRESRWDFFMKLLTPPSLEFEAKIEGGGSSDIILYRYSSASGPNKCVHTGIYLKVFFQPTWS